MYVSGILCKHVTYYNELLLCVVFGEPSALGVTMRVVKVFRAQPLENVNTAHSKHIQYAMIVGPKECHVCS